MYGDLHFEVVMQKEGQYRVYFSDAVRAELPPSVASDMTITITDGNGAFETLKPYIDKDGECWLAVGKPVDDVNATARVAFKTQGKLYWIDLPFGFTS